MGGCESGRAIHVAIHTTSKEREGEGGVGNMGGCESGRAIHTYDQGKRGEGRGRESIEEWERGRRKREIRKRERRGREVKCIRFDRIS